MKKPQTTFVGGGNPFTGHQSGIYLSKGNEARQKIMAAIAECKTASRKTLSVKLTLSKCSVEHHTRILTKLGLIVERKGDGGAIYYELAKAGVTSNDTQNQRHQDGGGLHQDTLATA